MSKFKKIVVIVAALLMTVTWTMPLYAADSSLKEVLEDSLYGGLIGSILGAATIAFTDHKSDHLNNIGYGAAIGVFAGAGYGVYTNMDHAFVEYENGKVRLAVPTVMPNIKENSTGEKFLVVQADILRGTF